MSCFRVWGSSAVLGSRRNANGAEAKREEIDWRDRRIDSKNSSYPAVLVSDLNWHRTWQDEYLQTSCGHDASNEYCRAAFEDTHHQIVCW
jgi:hypothetical protein